MNNVVGLTPNKTDKELAEEFKRRMIDILLPHLELLDEMDKAGFVSNIQTGKNGLGKHQFILFQVMKVY